MVAAEDRLSLAKATVGIYAFYITYGRLQEKIIGAKSPSGKRFRAIWFLQLCDSLASVAVAAIGRYLNGQEEGMPQKVLFAAGAAQVLSKYCFSLSLAAGLSFPVATLAKSAKMIPVMIGTMVMGGRAITGRQIAQAGAIVGGTSIVNLSERTGGGGASSSGKGLALILAALACDGFVGGMQRKIRTKLREEGKQERPYDLMFWCNLHMAFASLCFAAAGGELRPGLAFISECPGIVRQIAMWALCGACGQSCVYYTLAKFDAVLVSAVTTTRKLASVLLSIALGGGSLPALGWSGLGLASAGILAEAMH